MHRTFTLRHLDLLEEGRLGLEPLVLTRPASTPGSTFGVQERSCGGALRPGQRSSFLVAEYERQDLNRGEHSVPWLCWFQE